MVSPTMTLEIRNQTVERLCRGHTGAINRVKYTNNGSFCLSASDDKTIRLWNPSRDDPGQTHHSSISSALHIKSYVGVHNYPVYDISIASDNSKFVSVGGDKTFFLWDVGSGNIIRRIRGHDHRINAVDMNADSTVVVSGSYDRTVKIWDLRSQMRDPIQVLPEFRDSVTSVVVSDYQIIAASVDGNIKTFDLRAGKCYTDSMNDSVVALGLSNDIQCVFATCLSNCVRLVDLKSGFLLQEYKGNHKNSSYRTDCLLLPSDNVVVCGSEDCALSYYNFISGEPLAHLSLEDIDENRKNALSFRSSKSFVSSLACHPKLSYLAVGMSSGTLACAKIDLSHAL